MSREYLKTNRKLQLSKKKISGIIIPTADCTTLHNPKPSYNFGGSQVYKCDSEFQ